MAGFLKDACHSADLPGAAARAGLTLVEIRRYRGSDPLFDLEMATVDASLRLAAVEAVRAKAASGDLKAIRALTDGTVHQLADETRARRVLPIDHPLVVGPVLSAAALRWESDPRSTHDLICPCGQYLTLKSRWDSTGVITIQTAEHFPRPSSLRPGGPRGEEPEICAAETPTTPCPQCGAPAKTAGPCKQCGCLIQFPEARR